MELNEIIRDSSNIANAFIALNIVTIATLDKKLKPYIWWFGAFLLVSFIVQIWASYLSLRKMPNLFLVHYYTFFEFIFLSLFYSKLINKYKFVRQYFLTFITIVGLLIILNTIFLQPLTEFSSNARTLAQSIYIIYAIAYFFQEIATYKKTVYERMIININSAVLIYYSGSFFIFLFSNISNIMVAGYDIFWIINALLYLIFQLLIFLALWTFWWKNKSILS